jgi:hypothetical protein
LVELDWPSVLIVVTSDVLRYSLKVDNVEG